MTLHVSPAQLARLQKSLGEPAQDMPLRGADRHSKPRKGLPRCTDTLRVLSGTPEWAWGLLHGRRHRLTRVDEQRHVTACMIEFHAPQWQLQDDESAPQCAACSLKEKGPRTMYEWTRDTPKEPGWYWFADALRDPGASTYDYSGVPDVMFVWEGIKGGSEEKQLYAIAVRDAENNYHDRKPEEFLGWWAGPIPEPEGYPEDTLPIPPVLKER